MGNLRSVAKALAHVAPATRVVVTGDAGVIGEADKVVLPGQSAMPDCISHLDASGLRGAVLDAARTRPFLGICLGLQMLFDDSEEGPTRCLGLLPGVVRRFDAAQMTGAEGQPLKVPHMGWNRVHPVRSHPMWNGVADGERFYFAHSYHPVPADPALTAATTNYPAPFTCAIARANIFATQFHPEKSQRAGLALLANFVGWDGRHSA
ncbi:MAG: imidazole glycerol phosphate synthase subunit HisH [Proteobacteria bacterium]|nr:imidazole glycerol phosphate synthase subunit HisH [Pseudomonadota bacterium]